MDRTQLLRRAITASRETLESARCDLASLDAAPDPDLRRHEIAFDTWCLRPGTRITRDEWHEDLAKARLLLVGDFATSPAPKQEALRLLKRFPKAALAVNIPTVDDAGLMAEWLHAGLPGPELLAGIPGDIELPEAAWRAWRRLLRHAWVNGHSILLFEPRSWSSLDDKNAAAARALRDQWLGPHRQRPLIVLVGEMRLHPGGLPRHLARDVPRARTRTVLFDPPAPYYHGLAQGRSGHGIFRLDDTTTALCTGTPLARLQSFLAWYDWDDDPIPATQLRQRFAEFAGRIQRFFQLPDDVGTMPRIYAPGDPRYLPALHRHTPLSQPQADFLLARMQAGESRFFPEANLVYIGNIGTTHVAEEAAHFVRARVGGSDLPEDDAENRFWAIALHEAAGWLGSKVIAPHRRPGKPTDVAPAQPADREALAHAYGYNLGERLWTRLAAEPRLLSQIQPLFVKDLVEPGAAKALYFRSLHLASGRS